MVFMDGRAGIVGIVAVGGSPSALIGGVKASRAIGGGGSNGNSSKESLPTTLEPSRTDVINSFDGMLHSSASSSPGGGIAVIGD